MKLKMLAVPAVLAVCMVHPRSAASQTGGQMSGSVVEYNAAQVRTAHGAVTVPTGMVTYTANSAIPTYTDFNVTLPQGFEFATEPSLTSSAATFDLINVQGGTARFMVSSGEIDASGTIVLGGYNVKDADALEKIVPSGAALPVTMQAIGIDPQPLPFKEFASDSGIQVSITGNPQTLNVDLGSPANGSQFFVPPSTLSSTAELANITITAEANDSAGVPVLSPNGNANSLDADDTVTFQFPGVMFGGISVFASTSAACSVPNWRGIVQPNFLIYPNLPLNQSIYLCVKASGHGLMKLIGYPNGENTLGFSTGLLINSKPKADFLSSGDVNINSFATVCYTPAAPTNLTCAPEFYNLSVPDPGFGGQE